MRHFILVGIWILSQSEAFADKSQFWNQTRRGTNFFNEKENPTRMANAKAIGIEFIRLTFTKWASTAPGSRQGEFLVGSFDEFKELVPGDLAILKKTLDQAHQVGLAVVLTPLSLPGARWRQHNQNKLDSRLWKDPNYQTQCANFWRALAQEIKDHPAVVGYNLLNEPYPEAAPPRLQDWYTGDYPAWAARVKNSAADLNAFNRALTKAIREVDRETPIIVDSGFYSTPYAFKVLEPTGDPNTLYSFHMYEPYAFTSYQQLGKSQYPGKIAIGEAEPPATQEWNREALHEFLEPVRAFQTRYKIANHKILVGEFGVARKNTGAPEYLRDLIAVLQSHHWHWAFYSFQEDTWEGMDYQLGTKKLPAEYWTELEKGHDTRRQYYCPNALFDALTKALRP